MPTPPSSKSGGRDHAPRCPDVTTFRRPDLGRPSLAAFQVFPEGPLRYGIDCSQPIGPRSSDQRKPGPNTGNRTLRTSPQIFARNIREVCHFQSASGVKSRLASHDKRASLISPALDILPIVCNNLCDFCIGPSLIPASDGGRPGS